jgi:heterodisulfide reductase subunit B
MMNMADTTTIKPLDALNLKYSLFLGCVIPNRYPQIERASQNLFDHLGIEIQEMMGATCCPAPGVFRSVDKAVWVALGARNIAISQENKSDLLTLCNGCYGSLLDCDHELKTNPLLFNRVNKILNEVGRNYDASNKVRQIMDILYFDIGVDRLKQLVKHKLGLKVAVHYGCHLLKPSNVKPFNSDPDNPRFFDEVVESLGCESVDYRDKLICCGAAGALRTNFKDKSLKFTLQKLREIRKVGADCIVTSCPFCQLQFDLGQLEISDMLDADEAPFRIPVIYIAQLIGLALEIDLESLGLISPPNMKGVPPFVSIQPILDKIKKPITQGVDTQR